MGSVLEDLKRAIQCSLCNDTLTEPKILKCFHSFCKPCIKRHAELIEKINIFKCPKCKSETPLLRLNSVDDLKPSVLHSRLVKVLEFVEGEKVCSVSGSHPPASWHCLDCNRSLCDECEKNHSEFIKDHEVVSLVETKEEDLKVMLAREKDCARHTGTVVELFCKDCKQDICMKCLKACHDEHSTISLSKHTAKTKAFLFQQLQELEALEQRMKKQVEIISEETSELKTNCEEAKLVVKERLRDMLDTLQKNAQELLKEIDDTVDKAEKRKIRGQSVLDQTRGAIEYTKTLIKKGVSSEVMENKDIKKACFTSVDRVVGEQSDVLFIANEELTRQVKLTGLGILKRVVRTDPSMSKVEKCNTLEEGKRGKLVVTTKSKAGKPSDDSSDVIDVKITPLEKLKTLERGVRSKGIFEVGFVPKKVCQLTAEVRVNGKHVSNSPLVMNVRSQSSQLPGRDELIKQRMLRDWS